MKRFDVINEFIHKRNFVSYLEIGVRNKQDCFDKIKCLNKTCVDPNKDCEATFTCTSDQFFIENKQHFDIIFIDGLHLSEQVEIDILNSLKHISNDGVIILHDCHPTNKNMQTRNYLMNQPWTGDVWKAWVKFRSNACYKTYTIDTDWGIGVIDTKFKQLPINFDYELSYNMLLSHQDEYLNLININSFKSML